MFAVIIISTTALGIAVALLGHPMVYRGVFKRGGRSADHEDLTIGLN